MKYFLFICLLYCIQSCSTPSGGETSDKDNEGLTNCVEQAPLINYADAPEENKAIRNAIIENDTLALDSILAVGLGINETLGYGTLLDFAISFNRLSMFDRLLAKGANPNIIDQDGYVPLHVALTQKPENNQLYYVEQLLLAGASVTVIDSNGWDLLDWCSQDPVLESLFLKKCHTL